MVRGLWLVWLCEEGRCLARDDDDELVRGRNRLLSAHVSLVVVVVVGIMVADSVICFRFVIVLVVDDGADMDLVPLEGLIGVVEEQDVFVDLLLDKSCFSFFFFLPRDDRLRCSCCCWCSIHDGLSLSECLTGWWWWLVVVEWVEEDGDGEGGGEGDSSRSGGKSELVSKIGSALNMKLLSSSSSLIDKLLLVGRIGDDSCARRSLYSSCIRQKLSHDLLNLLHWNW